MAIFLAAKQHKILLIGLGLLASALGAAVLMHPQSLLADFSKWLDAPVPLVCPFGPRGIETNRTLLVNGYFAFFLRTDYFGFLNWLAMPIMAYILFTWRRQETWKLGMAALCGTALLLLIWNGSYNYRYILSVFPLILTLILLALGRAGGKSAGWRRMTLRGGACLLIMAALLGGIRLDNNTVKRWFAPPSFDLEQQVRQIPLPRPDSEDGKNLRVLECNLPEIYYYTNASCVSITHPDIYRLIAHKNIDGAYDYMINHMKVGYILITPGFLEAFKSNEFKMITEIALKKCKIIFANNRYVLYKINVDNVHAGGEIVS